MSGSKHSYNLRSSGKNTAAKMTEEDERAIFALELNGKRSPTKSLLNIPLTAVERLAGWRLQYPGQKAPNSLLDAVRLEQAGEPKAQGEKARAESRVKHGYHDEADTATLTQADRHKSRRAAESEQTREYQAQEDAARVAETLVKHGYRDEYDTTPLTPADHRKAKKLREGKPVIDPDEIDRQRASQGYLARNGATYQLGLPSSWGESSYRGGSSYQQDPSPSFQPLESSSKASRGKGGEFQRGYDEGYLEGAFSAADPQFRPSGHNKATSSDYAKGYDEGYAQGYAEGMDSNVPDPFGHYC